MAGDIETKLPDDEAGDRSKENVGLKLALELGPLMVFFFGNLYSDKLVALFPSLSSLGGPIFIATGLFMAATIASLIASKILVGKLPLMPLISGGVVLVFGTLSIWLQNELFVKMKPTIINTLFGVILLGGMLFGRSLLGYVFNSAFQLDDRGWNKLTLRWGLFFIFLAVLNEVLWRSLNWYYLPDAKTADALWISSKLWVTMPVTFLFTLSQLPLIMRHTVEVKDQ